MLLYIYIAHTYIHTHIDRKFLTENTNYCPLQHLKKRLREVFSGFTSRMDTERSAMCKGSRFTLPSVGLHTGSVYPSAPQYLKVNTEPLLRNLWVSHQGVNGRPSPTVTNWKLFWLMMSQAKGHGTLGRHLIYLSLWNNSKKGTLLDYMSHLRKIFIIAPAKRLMTLWAVTGYVSEDANP